MRYLAAILLALVIGACGEDDGGAVSAPDPDRPVQSPADPPQVEEPSTPPRCKRASRRLGDRPLEEAHRIAEQAGCTLRIVIEDGQSLPVTDDYSLSRINVRIDDGRVTKLLGIF